MENQPFLTRFFLTFWAEVPSNLNKLDTIKEMIRALGENPEQLLSREALSMGNISAVGDIENHQLSVLTVQLRDILRKAAET
jgi:hypothetical protein